jgi:hypothetical protein
VVSPTWRMPSAYRKRASVVCLLLSSAATRLAALLSAMRSSAASLATPSLYSSGSVRIRPPSTSWSTSLSPRPSMSIARRPAKCSSACLRCAAQNRPPLQRWSMPPRSRRRALPHTGHWPRHAEVGHVGRRAARHPAHHLGDHVAGTAHDHRVAHAHALAPQLEQVVQRGVADRGAAHEHRFQLGHRRELAGAADLDLDVVEQRSSAPAPGTCAPPPSAARASRSPGAAAVRSRSTL